MTLLNEADALYSGSSSATKAYAGATEVWSAVAGFLPTDISGIAAWHDATQLALSDGADVTSWPNLIVDSGRNSSIAGTPPIYKTAIAPGSKPVVRFSYTGGGLRGSQIAYYGAGTPIFNTDWTLHYVSRYFGPNPGRCFSSRVNITDNCLIGYHGSGWDAAYAQSAWITTPSTYPSPPTAWKLYAADCATGVGTRFFINGTQSGGLGAVVQLAKCYNLNGGGDSSGNEPGDWDVCELVMYDRRLNDTERGQVNTYLTTKWGIT